MYIERSFKGTDGRAYTDRGETPREKIDYIEFTKLIDDDGNLWMSTDPADVLIVETMAEWCEGDVLEIGLGMAYSAVKIKDKARNHKVIELDSLVETIGREHWPERMPDDISFGDYKEVLKSVRDESFDTVFIDIDTMGLGIPHKDKKGLSIIARVLKPGGILLPYISEWPTREDQLPEIDGFRLIETRMVEHEGGMRDEYAPWLRRKNRQQGSRMNENEITATVQAERERQTRRCVIGKWRKL